MVSPVAFQRPDGRLMSRGSHNWYLKCILKYRGVMQLTRFTDLGLRIVMRLAVVQPGDRPGSKDIAEQLAISYTHAAKVIARLSELGIVDARRGRGGGLAITELGRTASIGWLARRLEGESEVIECDGSNPCPLRAGCLLRPALRRAREAFFASLDELVIDDVTSQPTRGVLLTLPAMPSRSATAKSMIGE